VTREAHQGRQHERTPFLGHVTADVEGSKVEESGETGQEEILQLPFGAHAAPRKR
jgi:hypothetical protein